MLTWIGVSWRAASSSRRADLRELDTLVPDGVAVHTCARDGWLIESSAEPLVEALLRRGFRPDELDVRSARAGVERLFQVAVGLDSAVQGEADVGRQVRAALAACRAPLARVLDHVLARLLRQGRRGGWIREGEGVGSLAVRILAHHPRVGVVGAGALGGQVARALGPRAAVYNRTAKPGARALSALEPAEAWVIASSAPAAWFRPPEPYATLIDLGHPAQAFDEPRRVSLDALLAGARAVLPPDQLREARRAARCAADNVMDRLAHRAAPDNQVSA